MSERRHTWYPPLPPKEGFYVVCSVSSLTFLLDLLFGAFEMENRDIEEGQGEYNLRLKEKVFQGVFEVGNGKSYHVR